MKPDEIAELEHIYRTANKIRRYAYASKDSTVLDCSQHILDITIRILGEENTLVKENKE